LQLLADDPARAMRIASAGVWRHDLRTRDRQELLVVHALASRATGRAGEALDSFRRAHALARDTGNIEAFLLVPGEVRRELLDATGLELGGDWATRLDAARAVYPCAVDLVRLSPRELEVLRRLPHHETAAALARHLSVSVNTVKKQLGSLYAKLGAGNRSAALLRAQELGLLDSSPVAGGS
jgi:LuxR family maltose regulon positive regulatory protein